MVIAAKAVDHATASGALMRESQIEKYLVKRVKELGGEVRKVQWIGRRAAPDRLVMLPERSRGDISDRPFMAMAVAVNLVPELAEPVTAWVEVKNPETIKTFPADALERAQAREHERMRKLGQRVEVIGTIEQVEALLA